MGRQPLRGRRGGGGRFGRRRVSPRAVGRPPRDPGHRGLRRALGSRAQHRANPARGRDPKAARELRSRPAPRPSSRRDSASHGERVRSFGARDDGRFRAPLLTLGLVGVLAALIASFGGGSAFSGWPILPLPLAACLFAESLGRLGYAFLTGDPIGSLAGTAFATVFRRLSPAGPPRPEDILRHPGATVPGNRSDE